MIGDVEIPLFTKPIPIRNIPCLLHRKPDWWQPPILLSLVPIYSLFCKPR
jgi:hypothetical protein